MMKGTVAPYLIRDADAGSLNRNALNVNPSRQRVLRLIRNVPILRLLDAGSVVR